MNSCPHPAAQTIDAHHHLWRYTAPDFDWLQGPFAPLRRDFLPEHLLPAMQAAQVDGVITVQACQTLDETRWLLSLAEASPEIRGVVGWAPLTDPTLPGVLDDLRVNPALKGLRHIVQAEPDPDFILRADFNAGIRTLTAAGLVYDILIFERHLPQTIAFVDRHPHQQFVIDHLAKPRIAEGTFEPWAARLHELARRPNVACKLSGLVTEADPHCWTPGQLTVYLETAVEAFGPARLLVGSDWPVLLAGCDYPRWFQLLRDFFAPYSPQERDAIFGRNAIDLYHL